MLYASTEEGKRIGPERNQHALCPGCRASVISKCGNINIWHWAHVSGQECDPWYEAETRWHINWKMQFEESCREVVMGTRRADIRATRKIMSVPYVIELQHSPIEFAEIIEREDFYGRMVWLLDGNGFKDHFEFGRAKKANGGATIIAPSHAGAPDRALRLRPEPPFFDRRNAQLFDRRNAAGAESRPLRVPIPCAGCQTWNGPRTKPRFKVRWPAPREIFSFAR